MDSYRQDSVYTSTSGLDPADFKTLTPEEKATCRSWRRAVMAFYCALEQIPADVGHRLYPAWRK
jgi:hypothetical protein